MSSNPPSQPNLFSLLWQGISSWGSPIPQQDLGPATTANAAAIGAPKVFGAVTGIPLPGGLNIGGILKVAFGGLLILLALALAFLPEIGEGAAIAAGQPSLAPAVGGALRGKPRAGVKKAANTLADAMAARAAQRAASRQEARTDIRRSEKKTGQLASRETYVAAGQPELYERRLSGELPLSGGQRFNKPPSPRVRQAGARARAGGPSPIDRIIREQGPEEPPPAAGPVPPRPAPPGPSGPASEEPEGVRRERAKAQRERAWQGIESTMDAIRQPPPARRLADQPLTAPPTASYEPGEQPRPSRVPGMLGVPSPIPRELPQTQPTREGTQGGTLGMRPGTPTTEEYRQFRERQRNATLRKQANEFMSSVQFYRQAADAAEREGNLGAARRLRAYAAEAHQRWEETSKLLLEDTP